MRRLAVLAVLAVLVGCNGDEASSSSAAAGTVAIGELPGTLPTSSTSSTTAPPTTTTTLPGDSTVLAVELAALFDGATAPAPAMEPVADDTGQLSIAVPIEWTDRRTAPSIAASTDLARLPRRLRGAGDDRRHRRGFTCAGAAGVRLRRGLRAGGAGPLRDRAPRRRSTGPGGSCGGTGTAIVTVGVETDDGTTVVVLAQLLGPADLAALDLDARLDQRVMTVTNPACASSPRASSGPRRRHRRRPRGTPRCGSSSGRAR